MLETIEDLMSRDVKKPFTLIYERQTEAHPIWLKLEVLFAYVIRQIEASCVKKNFPPEEPTIPLSMERFHLVESFVVLAKFYRDAAQVLQEKTGYDVVVEKVSGQYTLKIQEAGISHLCNVIPES